MLDPNVYDHPVKNIELIETHISWVFLTGEFAYKIKKPVDFGFLDFSTLEKRRDFCEQELNLNNRLAPAIYLSIVSITGTYDKPTISGNGEVIEYAVKMRQFPQLSQLDRMLAAGKLDVGHMDAIAIMVADFHQTVQLADESVDFGDEDLVNEPVEENFFQIKEHLKTNLYLDALDDLQQWSFNEWSRLKPIFEQRKSDGFVRECHGDMHLRNLIWFDGRAMAFDCIEFDPRLRWIDVISDVAFLVMDLQDRCRPDLASRFLNSYLEATGDYAGLSVLPFYLSYRAMVRAKVDALRLEQSGITKEERAQTLSQFESYIELARSYSQESQIKLIIMRGVSASGKTTLSQQLLDNLGVIRLRSDVERKRSFGITLPKTASNDIDAGLYSAEASQKTYSKLAELASEVISAGYSVVVDAAFLRLEQYDLFLSLANRLCVAFIVLEVSAPEDVLRQRIMTRKQGASDADIEVLDQQLANWQPLNTHAMDHLISIDTTAVIDIEDLIKRINA